MQNLPRAQSRHKAGISARNKSSKIMVFSPNGLQNAKKRVPTASPIPRFCSLLLYFYSKA
jgi:hypothetical protein